MDFTALKWVVRMNLWMSSKKLVYQLLSGHWEELHELWNSSRDVSPRRQTAHERAEKKRPENQNYWCTHTFTHIDHIYCSWKVFNPFHFVGKKKTKYCSLKKNPELRLGMESIANTVWFSVPFWVVECRLMREYFILILAYSVIKIV